MDPTQVTELALRLGWLERLELAQRLLLSLHPREEDSRRPVVKLDQHSQSSGAAAGSRSSIKLPNPIPYLEQPTQSSESLETESIQLDSIAISFRKLRDALESSLEP